MKISFVRIHSFRNEEWFQFMTEFKFLVEKYSAATLNITALFATFVVCYNNTDIALEIVRKSIDTALMKTADKKRDRSYRGLVDVIRAFLNHSDPYKRECAQKLSVLVDHYGNLSQKAPNEETAGINNLLQDMAGQYGAQISQLNLGEWMNQLSVDNAAYEALVRDRNTETSARSKLKAKECRTQTDAVYAQIVERIDSAIVINGAANYTLFVNELNAFIKRYNDVLAERKGISASKRDAGEATGEAEAAGE
jgi:hypothetical protein